MSILDTLRQDMFSATKAGEGIKVDILKLAMAAIKNAQIESQEELTDDDIIKILRKEVRKVEDSIEQFTKIGRTDLVEKETAQLKVLEQYLPQQMAREELEKLVKSKIEEIKPEGMKDMGKVMGAIMKEVGTDADGNIVREIVQQHLQ